MNINIMLEEAQKVQKNIEEIQKKLETEEITISDDAGTIKIKLTGGNKFTELTIAEKLKNGSVEELQKALLATIQKAIDVSRQKNQEAMKEITESLALPSLEEIKATAAKAPKS